MSARQILLLLLSFLVFGAGLRIYGLGAKSFWMDELLSLEACYEATTLRGLTYLAARQAQPPLDSLIGFALARVYDFGDWGEFLFRLPAALFSIGALGMLFVVGRTVVGARVVLVAVFLAAISPGFIAYAQQARPYSIFFFFYLLTLGALYRAVHWNHPIDWAAFCVVSFLMLLSKGMAPIAVIAAISVSVVLCAAYLGRVESIRPWPLVVKAGCALGIACGLFLPFLRVTYLVTRRFVDVSIEAESVVSGLLSLTPLVELGQSVLPLIVGRVGMILIPFYLVGGYVAWRERHDRPWTWFIFLVSFIEPVIHTYMYHAVVTGVEISARYFLHAKFLILVFASLGLIRLAIRANAWRRTSGWVLLIIVLAPLTLAYSKSVHRHYTAPYPDYRAVGEYFKNSVRRSDDVVLFFFVPYAPHKWLPHIHGERVYFHRVRQWYLHDYVREVRRYPDAPNNLHFVLYTYQWWDDPRPDLGLDRATFHVEPYQEFVIIRVHDPNLTRGEVMTLMMEEMERFYPQTSARVRLYRHRANLICDENPQGAARYIAMAREWAPDVALDSACVEE